MTYSLDYRKRVLAIKQTEGLTYEETSQRFKVGIASLFRWKKELAPKRKKNRPSLKVDMEALRADVEKHPDRFQYERAKDYGVNPWTIGVALKRLGVSYKKNAESSESGRGGTYMFPSKDDTV